jgi:hypothetical protein
VFVFWILIVATALTPYLGAYVVLGILVVAAKIIGSEMASAASIDQESAKAGLRRARPADSGPDSAIDAKGIR